MKKRFILSTFFTLVVMVCFAQNKIVNSIRTQYTDAQKHIAQMKDERNCANYVTVKKNYVVPAIGPVEETIEFFMYDDNDDEKNPGGNSFKLFFVRKKVDGGPTVIGKTFYEYLFSKETGNLIFAYDKSSGIWAEDMVWTEIREYYDNKGKLISTNHKMTSQEDGTVYPNTGEFEPSDGVRSKKDAAELKKLFELLAK